MKPVPTVARIIELTNTYFNCNICENNRKAHFVAGRMAFTILMRGLPYRKTLQYLAQQFNLRTHSGLVTTLKKNRHYYLECIEPRIIFKDYLDFLSSNTGYPFNAHPPKLITVVRLWYRKYKYSGSYYIIYTHVLVRIIVLFYNIHITKALDFVGATKDDYDRFNNHDKYPFYIHGFISYLEQQTGYNFKRIINANLIRQDTSNI